MMATRVRRPFRQALSRVCDGEGILRGDRGQTLIGKGFSYSSAPLVGTDLCFSTNILGIPSLKFSSAIGPLAGAWPVNWNGAAD